MITEKEKGEKGITQTALFFGRLHCSNQGCITAGIGYVVWPRVAMYYGG